MAILCMGNLFAQNSMTPSQILSKTVNLITGSKGTEANFNITHSGYTGKGLIKSSGQKYNVVLPEVEVWYNGKELYTYNKSTQETTLVDPTADEIAESNPLAYVTSAQNKYNVAFSTVKKNGKYVLELTPKAKGESIKRVTLTLNRSNFYPEKIVVEPVSGSPITSEITQFKTGLTLKPSDFEYPKSKYPRVEIVDLR